MSTASTGVISVSELTERFSALEFELVSGEIITLSLRGSSPQVVIASIFYAQYFRGDDGVYYNAACVKRITPKEETQ